MQPHIHRSALFGEAKLATTETFVAQATETTQQSPHNAPIALAVIVPTLNEVDNLQPLIQLLDEALTGIVWEAIFVDDNSSDGTADRLREIGQHDRRIRVIQRVGRRGLSSAVIEGMLATSAPTLAVIDADLQHDETILPLMHKAITADGYDLAIGTRYMEGGSTGEWDASRKRISRIATQLSSIVMKTPANDPMSGFFAVRRDVLMDALPRMSNVGFKILLDLLASTSAPLKVKEVPYTFRTRVAGESKLDNRVAQEFFILLLEKLIGRYVPVRFLMFAFVGSLGLLVHLTVLGITVALMGGGFRMGQALAVFTAMTFNFILNNSLTYRDQKLVGRAFARGLLSFYAVCLIGALGNIGVGEMIYNLDQRWWLGGIAGALVGVVWNYAVSSVFTWKKR